MLNILKMIFGWPVYLIKWYFSEWWVESGIVGRVFKIILAGIIGAPFLYVIAFGIEVLACFVPGWRCLDIETGGSISSCTLGSVWTGAAFGGTFTVLSIAGVVIGIIYAIAAGTQEKREEWTEEWKRENYRRGGSVDDAIKTIGIVRNKSNAILSLIKDAEKNILSANARKILGEAITESNEFAPALEKTVRIVENVRGKTSKMALKDAQQAEESSRLLEKNVVIATDLYNQAIKEENDWNRIQKEANDAVITAKKALENAIQETVKIEKRTFTSSSANDAAEKASFAFARAKEAEVETVKRRDAAATASSAQKAQIELSQAKYSEKKAIVEAKIAAEEVKIAVEADAQKKGISL